MSGEGYQEVVAALENCAFVHDLFQRFQNDLDTCCKTHYGSTFTRVINNDGFLLWFLQAIVAAHSNAPAESNAVCRRHTGELHTEGGYFEDNWCPPQNPIDPESARLSVLFHDVSYLSREENVRKAIEVVDQQLPEREDTTMSDPHGQNQPPQQHTQLPPSSPERYQANTASSGNPQTQQMRTQQTFCLAQANILNRQSPGQFAGNTSESGESSGAQSDNSFASGRKNGKRVAGRYYCTVEDCPKKDEPMQKCRLDDHMALHEPSLRTQCPGCEKVYMHSRTCNDHAKKVHGMDLKTLQEQQPHQYAQPAASLGNLEEGETMVMAMTS